MVEFRCCPAEHGVCSPAENYLEYRLPTRLCVIKLASDYWYVETNTFTASFHARLNVALQHVIRRFPGQCEIHDNGGSRHPR
jgi:hypothetical protein